ncbi:hypothetical protein QZH41_008413, partial [Actinostola sp. cb2023]
MPRSFLVKKRTTEGQTMETSLQSKLDLPASLLDSPKEDETIKPKGGEQKKPSNRPFDIANLTRPDKPAKKPAADAQQIWRLQLHSQHVFSDLETRFHPS